MVDTVEIKEAETTSEKPVEEKQSTQSVEGLPEKFKSVEEMAKSYSELEKKLGEQSQPKPEVDPVSATTLKGEESKPEVKQDEIAKPEIDLDHILGSDLCFSKEFKEAEIINTKYLHLYELLFTEASPSPCKFLLEKMSLLENNLRLPLVRISEKLEKEIDEIYSNT